MSLGAGEFGRLAEIHRPRALRFASAFLGDPDRAQDLVQEALGRLFERRDDYPLDTHFGPYLVKVLARLCVDQKRSARPGRGLLSLFQREPEQPPEALEKRETRRKVGEAVGRLAARERACLLLVVCEGMGHAEAAEALSLTPSEVNNALHRARTALREDLKEVGS